MIEQKITAENVDIMWPSASEAVKCYMRLIVRDLESQYNNNIPDYMIVQLDLLYDLITLYKKAQMEQAGQPLVLGEGQRKWQNPAQMMIRETSKQMINLMKEMGLTMFSKQKMKILKQKTKDNSENSEELLKALLE
jgi:phage terminase small subunit